ncbi:MAG: hypothetical protein AB7V77_01335 [Candidatus Woesearchaeota archaeon]
MNKKILITTICLLMFLVLPMLTSAYGIAPAKTTLNFESNLKQNFEFFALSTGEKPIYFSLELDGDLAQYAKLNQKFINMQVGERKKSFNVELNLPETLPPGQNILQVKLIEQSIGSTATATATNVLVSQIIVYAPYTGIYVESELEIKHGEVSKPMEFTVSLYGRGDIPAYCHATIDIKNPKNETLDTIVTNKIMVAQGEATKITATWDKNSNAGLFDAYAQVHCGDKINNLYKQFYVGNPTVSVLEIKADKFVLGKVSPIAIILKNNWNRDFKDVYVRIEVFDELNNSLQNFKSASQEIPAEEIREVTAYWETKDLDVGNYLLKVITYFDNKGSFQESFVATLGIDDLFVQKASGQVIGAKQKTSLMNSSLLSIIIIFLIIIIIFNVALIMFLKKKKVI